MVEFGAACRNKTKTTGQQWYLLHSAKREPQNTRGNNDKIKRLAALSESYHALLGFQIPLRGVAYLGLLVLDLVHGVAALNVEHEAEVLARLGDGDDVFKGKENEVSTVHKSSVPWADQSWRKVQFTPKTKTHP